MLQKEIADGGSRDLELSCVLEDVLCGAEFAERGAGRRHALVTASALATLRR